MKNEMGVWIDHQKAVIVHITDAGEETKQITSNLENRNRFISGVSEDGSSEDSRGRKYGNLLNSFYDEVIAVLRNAETIQVFGPGEAKGELAARLEKEGLKERIAAVETVDKMTDPQIAARVRERI